jgi:hypothetical protein
VKPSAPAVSDPELDDTVRTIGDRVAHLAEDDSPDLDVHPEIDGIEPESDNREPDPPSIGITRKTLGKQQQMHIKGGARRSPCARPVFIERKVTLVTLGNGESADVTGLQCTVNLPENEFPMRAGLPKREPEMLQNWYDMDLYGRMLRRTEGRPLFVLHDGPPFSNGMIHMGTALNKCLKDFINRYKSMSGWHATYTPGWDNHGMPIESAIIKEQKLNHQTMSVSEFRSECEAFARRFVEVQKAQFIRLGCLGDWDHPYLTMDPKFEAEEVRVFGAMYEKGFIYKGKKPVYWCPHDETALAEAEIEYADDPCKSIYVKFRVKDDKGKLSRFCSLEKLYFIIWTTTTWTIPGQSRHLSETRDRLCVGKDSFREVYYPGKGAPREGGKGSRGGRTGDPGGVKGLRI